MTKRLLCLGFGYTARALADHVLSDAWQISGTVRDPEECAAVASSGVNPVVWSSSDLPEVLAKATHVLVSIAPDADGDPALNRLREQLIVAAPRLSWLGYLSTTGVYGDRKGGWVDETSALQPTTLRGKRRVEAEAAWQSLAASTGLPLHIFRLAGIYGPVRGPFAKVRSGSARRIIKAGQVFSRIHVDDIAATLLASINAPNPGAVYNLCDDDPAPPENIIEHAATLLGMPVPKAEPFEQADLTLMARSFYAESKRVRNDRIKSELGVVLAYPSYRDGLAALLRDET